MHVTLKIGPCRANRDLNQLEINGQAYKLRPRTMDLLIYMAERPGEVLSVDELLTGVWQGVIVSDSSVYQSISELRSVFETAGTENPIETIPKRGYLLKAFSDTREGAAQPRRRSFPVRSLITGAALVILVIGAFLIQSSRTEPPSVAVLAFEDLSPDGDKQWLADGIAEAAYNYLAQVDGLRVAPLRSSLYFKGSDADIATIGNQLDVSHVLEASVRSEDERLRVTVRLTDTESGNPVWSRVFEGEAGGIFDLEEGIAEAVATAIGISLGVGTWNGVPGMTRNWAAYEEFLRGKDLSPGGMLDPALVQTATDHMNRAVAIDPEFGLAWLQLAFLNSAVALGVNGMDDPAAARDRADFASKRAQQLMPDSPLVHEYLGVMATTEGRWTTASDYYENARRAAARDGSRQIGSNYHAELLIRVGRINEATGELERARAENPFDLDLALMLVLAYGSAGDTDAALREANRSLTLEERSLRSTATMAYSGLVALGSRDRSAITQWFGTPPEDPSTIDPMNPNRVGLAYLDEPTKALEYLTRLAQEPAPARAIPLATWAAYFGDAELALDAFSYASSGAQVIAVSHLWLPIFADMRRLPGFKQLVRDLGLVEYWRESGAWSDFCTPVGNDDFECH